MRVVGLIAVYNERRIIEPCLQHPAEQGVDAILIDNDSTDDTVRRAVRWLSDDALDTSEPRRRHCIEQRVGVPAR